MFPAGHMLQTLTHGYIVIKPGLNSQADHGPKSWPDAV